MGHHLRSEADAENGDSPVSRAPDEFTFRLDRRRHRLPVDAPLGAEQKNEIESVEFRPLVGAFAVRLCQRISVVAESMPHEARIGIGSIGHDETAHSIIVRTDRDQG